MSRVSRRAGTKALVCGPCQRGVKAKTGTSPHTVMSFRGKSQARLDRHLREKHQGNR
jgi:hypothetical protein